MTEPLRGAVLAAGHGTRLQPLTAHRPKPLVPLGAGRLIDHPLAALRAAGVARVGVNAHHLGAQVAPALAAVPEVVAVVQEAELQGTGGGIRGIAQALGGTGTLLSVNGDALFDFSLAAVLAQHRARGAAGTLALRRVPAGSPFARVGVDRDGRIHRIAEVVGPDAARQDLILGAYTGALCMEADLVARLPAGGPCDVLRSAWRDALADRAPLFGAWVEPADAPWFDVGTPDRYLAAHQALLTGALIPHGAPDADAQGRRIAADAVVAGEVVGPSAVLAGAVIEAGARVGPGCWIGAGARVRAGVRLTGCVVWPGVEVTAPAADAVLTG